MIDDIVFQIFEDLWEDNKTFGKALAATAGVSPIAYISHKLIQKKTLRRRLEKKIPDCYHPLNLTKHCWISGSQGSGKSNKLRRIFINTFVKQGWGGIYIDTHGTADEILASIPPERWKDVIYIAPWMGRVYGLNALQRYSDEPGEVDRIAEDVVDVFSKMYPRSWGDKLANAIRFSTKAVLFAEETDPNYNKPTLMDVYKVLTDELFRQYIIDRIDSDIIIDFLTGLKASAAISKLENPLSSENIVLFLCQQNGINMLDAMEEKKIIICNLDKDKLSENCNLMGGLLISIIAQCAAKRSEKQKHPYFALALDECHEYANKHINTLISQMRKKNICVLLANQYIDQLPKDVQPAVSMCQTKFIHTPADSDISYLSKIYKQWYSREELTEMPYFSCIHDIHDPHKKRSPFYSLVPPFTGDYDWEYVHKLKFASMSQAPERWKLKEELATKKREILQNEKEETNFTGEVEF